ncbi:MAG: hypothetical protein V7L12_15110 [Nostoc sp.]
MAQPLQELYAPLLLHLLLLIPDSALAQRPAIHVQHSALLKGMGNSNYPL